MKKTLLFICIPLITNPASLSMHRTGLTTQSRSCLRSSSTTNIPSSEAIDIPTPKGHTRTRSKSHIVEVPNEWASPSSSSGGAVNSWLSSHSENESLTSHSKSTVVADEKEKKWRKLRAAQFGSRHKRTLSEPTAQESLILYGLMHLSEDLTQQYHHMISKCSSSEKLHADAIRTQEEFKEDVGKLGYLFSLVETTDFEEYIKIITAQQRALDQRTAAIETLLARCEALTQKVATVAEQQETVTQELAVSHKGSEKRRSKSSFLSTFKSVS